MSTRVKATPEKAESAGITDTDKQMLLDIARQSVVAYLTGKPLPAFDVSEALQAQGAAFVTLTQNDELRGCIGTVQAYEPLYLAVSNCAISAATSDPRFDPVTADEIPRLAIEISVITPMTKVTDLNDIQIGRDGLLIQLGRRSGLLLPQVATEHNLSRTAFLEHTCLKACLPRDAYTRPEATIYRFQAIIFSEAKPAQSVQP